MSNNAQSNVLITFEGRTMSLETALKTTREGLAGTGTEASATGDKLAKMSDGEAKAGKEARNMGEAIRIAADEVGLLGVESGESYIKLQSLRHGATDLTAAFGGLKSGLIGGIGLGAAFAGASFLKEAVVDSIAGEQATNQLQAALRKTPGAFHETNRAIEESSTTWAKFGVSVGVLKAAVAQGVGAGIKPETIIGQPSQIADLAKALGEDIPSALGEIERGGRGADRVISRLNLSLVDQRRAMQQLANPNFSANDRTQFLLNLVQKTSFAGQGAAGTKGAQGQIVAFDASLANLKETVGTGILPVFTDMISSFSGLIQGANQMLSAVGGLSTFLQATWKPALIGISTIFLGLKISHSALGDFIRSRLLGDLSSSAGGFAEEANQATKAGDAIGMIPRDVKTLALFDAAGASGVKDAYLANIARIPGAIVPGLATIPNPMTTAAFDGTAATAEVTAYESSIKPVQVPVTFDTAGALVEPQATPIRIPVEYDTAQAFSEAQATPLKIPVEYDTAQAFNEAQAIPLNVPVTYNTANAFSEAATHPLSIPVTYDTTKAFSEAAATPLAIPVSYDTAKAFSEAQAHALSIPVTYDTTKAFSEANPRPITVPVTYDTSKSFSTMPVHPLDIPVTYDTKQAFREAYAHPLNIPVTYNTNHAFSEANPRPIRIPVTYDTTNAFHESGATPIKVSVTGTNAMVTPMLDPNASREMAAIRSKLIADEGGAIPVKVRPEWVSNAASGLKAGIAGGVSLAIADAIFQSVTISHTSGKTADPFGHAATTSFPSEIKTVPTGTQKVYVTNPGGIGSAAGFGSNAPKGDTWVSVKGQPTIRVAPGQKLDVGNFPANPIAATSPTGSTVKLPPSLDVRAHQSGGWTINLAPDAFARFGQMVGEIALGSMIGNVLGGLMNKIPFGTMLGSLKGLLGKGSGGGQDDFSDITKGGVLKGVEDLIAAHQPQVMGASAPIGNPSGGHVTYTGKEHVTSLQDVFNTAIKGLQIGAPLGAALYGAFRSGGVIKAASTGIGGMFESAFASIIALISFPIKGLTTTNKPKSGTAPAVAAAYAGAGLDLEILGLGKAVVGKFSDGVKAGWAALTQRISALFNDLVNAVIKPINSLLSHIPGTHPLPLAGASPSSSHPSTGGMSISMALPADMASGMSRVTAPAHHAATHHTTHQQVTHHTTVTNNVTITESKTPRETGDTVLKALSAAAQRKAKHGR